MYPLPGARHDRPAQPQIRIGHNELWAASSMTAWRRAVPRLFEIQPVDTRGLQRQALQRVALARAMARVPEAFSRPPKADVEIKAYPAYRATGTGEYHKLGLYSGPPDRMGLLSDQAARAARLVVDCGIHTGLDAATGRGLHAGYAGNPPPA